MGVLVDWQIRALCEQEEYKLLTPFSEAVSGGGIISYGLSSAGYDLRLGTEFSSFGRNDRFPPGTAINPKNFDKKILTTYTANKPFQIAPGSYLLGKSLEYIRMPRGVIGRCVGKSTLARAGLLINTTEVEPGWEGELVIEIKNCTDFPFWMFPGEGICQIVFHELSAQPQVSYDQKNGKYQGQTGVTLAKVL
jgi:dCTP deaminase